MSCGLPFHECKYQGKPDKYEETAERMRTGTSRLITHKSNRRVGPQTIFALRTWRAIR